MRRLIRFLILDSFFLVALIATKFIFQPVALVLPHHNIVATTRLQFLYKIKAKRLVTSRIILLSPDHFSLNQTQITSSQNNWNLSTGVLSYDSQVSLGLPLDDSRLKNDHGLYNPLADIKKVWPNTKVTPVLIGRQTTPDQLNSLLEKIKNNCRLDCLLIGSVDFSHYLPSTLADTHDASTLNYLQSNDALNLLNAEVDSPQSLYLLSRFSQSKFANSWNLFAHTNSGFIARNPDVETTTHVFGYYTSGFKSRPLILTFVSTPGEFDRSLNQNSVGDRFFYGTNFFFVGTSLPDFVIATIEYPTGKTIKSFLPVTYNHSVVNFIRGADKTKLITSLFDSLPADKYFTKDYTWGRLIYDRTKFTPTFP